MPDMPTLRDIVNTFTEQELDMTVPLDFKSVDADSLPYVEQYNKYLANGDYQSAYDYRIANSEILEPRIYDDVKANIQQALAINAYVFAKGEKSAENTSYDNTSSGVNASTVQAVLDLVLTQLGGYTIKKVSTLPSSPDSNTIYLVTG